MILFTRACGSVVKSTCKLSNVKVVTFERIPDGKNDLTFTPPDKSETTLDTEIEL